MAKKELSISEVLDKYFSIIQEYNKQDSNTLDILVELNDNRKIVDMKLVEVTVSSTPYKYKVLLKNGECNPTLEHFLGLVFVPKDCYKKLDELFVSRNISRLLDMGYYPEYDNLPVIIGKYLFLIKDYVEINKFNFVIKLDVHSKFGVVDLDLVEVTIQPGSDYDVVSDKLSNTKLESYEYIGLYSKSVYDYIKMSFDVIYEDIKKILMVHNFIVKG